MKMMTTGMRRVRSGRAPRQWGRAARALLRGGAGLVRRMHRAAAARREESILMSMPAHMLKDIGISRCEIEWRVRHGRTDRHGHRW